jgi:RNA polymerase sigma-70 factor (ECF subfamily)
MRDDSELLRAWGEGDAAAGRELFERHFAAIFRFFRNKADGDVEDLVQSTFASALGSREAFRGDASFRTYLFTIARHELYAFWRKRRRQSDEVDIGSLAVEDLATSPSSALAARRDRVLLARALRSLPLDFQVVLELHYWEELSGPELAAVLEVPEGTVRSRLRRGKELLALRFDELSRAEDGASSTSSADDVDRWAVSLKEAMGR